MHGELVRSGVVDLMTVQTYNVLWATLEIYLKQGLISGSRVLDIRNVDVSISVPLHLLPSTHTAQIVSGKILENDIPVIVVQFATQEVLLFRNAKTGDVVVGAEDKVEQCMYAAVFTRSPEDLANELTGGWKVIEVSRTPVTASHFSSPAMRRADGSPQLEKLSIAWFCLWLHPLREKDARNPPLIVYYHPQPPLIASWHYSIHLCTVRRTTPIQEITGRVRRSTSLLGVRL